MTEKIKKFIEEFKKLENRETIKINLISETKTPLTSSNVAGWFYLPKTSTIPTTSKGEQLMYLAQINCEELPENSIYPSKGIMQFWIFGGDYNLGSDYTKPTSDSKKRVIYYPEVEEHFTEEELSEMYKPEEDKKEGELITPINDGVPFAMSFEKTSQWPLPNDFRVEEIFNEKLNEHIEETKAEEGFESYDIGEEESYDIIEELDIPNHTQIGGYGHFTQEDPRMYDDFEDYTELLFQLDSEFGTDDYYILWGDCGVGNFFAKKEQIRNLDFAECLYSWDCC
ncbi:YwqG family protein [Mogibacterium diversum]